MAVDANVLIFERIREELRLGRSPISAVDAGYRRALTTIIDANLTTLIAAVLLYIFGSGPVRGFAVTLGIGLITSMFTAFWVTRLMVVLMLRCRRPKTLPISGPTMRPIPFVPPGVHLRFTDRRFWGFALSAL